MNGLIFYFSMSVDIQNYISFSQGKMVGWKQNGLQFVYATNAMASFPFIPLQQVLDDFYFTWTPISFTLEVFWDEN